MPSYGGVNFPSALSCGCLEDEHAVCPKALAKAAEESKALRALLDDARSTLHNLRFKSKGWPEGCQRTVWGVSDALLKKIDAAVPRDVKKKKRGGS